MTKQEIIKLFTVITALYPKEQAYNLVDNERSDITVKTWHTMLEDIPYNLAEAALQKHATVSQWPPTVAEIRQQAALISDPELSMTADEAWGWLKKSWARCGTWKQAREFLPKRVAKVAANLGWQDMGMGDVDVARGQFRRAWEASTKAQTEKQALPPRITNMIEEMTEKLRLKA